MSRPRKGVIHQLQDFHLIDIEWSVFLHGHHCRSILAYDEVGTVVQSGGSTAEYSTVSVQSAVFPDPVLTRAIHGCLSFPDVLYSDYSTFGE